MRYVLGAVLASLSFCLAAAPAVAGPREVFLAGLQQAIRQNDMVWLGSHLNYPVTIRGRHRLVLASKQALTKFDPALIGARLWADVLAQRPQDLSYNWQGMMIGSGQHNIWACDVSADPSRPDYRIFAMTGAN